MTGKRLGRNLWQQVHPPNFGCDSEILARTMLNAQYAGVAADPTLLSRGQFGRENENQLHIRTLGHAGLGVQEHAIRADITRVSA
jgi:hypothetical protein